MKEFIKNNKKFSILFCTISILAIVFCSLFTVSVVKDNNKKNYYKGICSQVLESQNFTSGQLLQMIDDMNNNFDIKDENEILNNIPNSYKETFYDVVKYSHACEEGYNLKPGTIASFYYKVLDIENFDVTNAFINETETDGGN